MRRSNSSLSSLEKSVRKSLVDVAKKLDFNGFLPGTSGNLSTKLSDDRVLITPSGKMKGELVSDDLVTVNLDGAKVQGGYEPSTESLLHLTIYRARLDAKAIIHVHSPYATAFAATKTSFDRLLLPELAEVLGEIPVVPYGATGTPELSREILPYLSRAHTFLLAHHGVVSFANEIQVAYQQIENVEFYAKVSLLSKLLTQGCVPSS